MRYEPGAIVSVIPAYEDRYTNGIVMALSPTHIGCALFSGDGSILLGGNGLPDIIWVEKLLTKVMFPAPVSTEEVTENAD